MPLPLKEMYTIAEIADRWNISTSLVEDYLLTEKLQPSIYLPAMAIVKYSLQHDFQCSSDDDEPYGYDIDYSDPDCIGIRHGIFNLMYQDIQWSEDGQAILEKGNACLTLPGEKEVFGFDETYTLNRDKVIVTIFELNRFEEEYSIVPHERPIYSVGTTSNSTSPEPSDNEKLNPKRERTLLTIIAALLEIIEGDSVIKDNEVVRHPSIKNQQDLIESLAEMETKGLSKRNLQNIFAAAKETKRKN